MAPLAHITWRDGPRLGTLWKPVAALALAGSADSTFAANRPPRPAAAPPTNRLRLEIPGDAPVPSSIASSFSGPSPSAAVHFHLLTFLCL